MLTFSTKAFSELDTRELYDLFRLRSEVFVVEQSCVYQDIDAEDLHCLHVLAYEDGRLAACARLLAHNVHREASVGRVAVSPAFRGLGYGKLLMKHCIREVLERFGTEEFVISAQQYLEAFYTELGFATESAMYLEDGIPHIKMRYRCAR